MSPSVPTTVQGGVASLGQHTVGMATAGKTSMYLLNRHNRLTWKRDIRFFLEAEECDDPVAKEEGELEGSDQVANSDVTIAGQSAGVTTVVSAKERKCYRAIFKCCDESNK